MPQMLAIQPAPPQGPPQAPSSGSKGNKEHSQFSPHLENAISNKKQQQHHTARNKSDKNSSSSTDKSLSTDEKNQSLGSQVSEDKDDSLSVVAIEEQLDASKDTPELSGPAAPLGKESTLSTTKNSDFSQTLQTKSASNLIQNISAATGNELNKSGKTPDLTIIKPELPPAVAEPVVAPATIQPIAMSRQDALISQLQQIIDNSNESGTVSISKTDTFIPNSNSTGGNIYGLAAASLSGKSEPVLVTANSETAALNLNGLLAADVEGIEKTVAKPVQQLNGLRHDSQQQYFNAKANTKNLAENNQNSHDNNQGDELAKQTTGSLPQSGPTGAMEQTNTFSQISAAARDTTTQPATDSAKPILLPSGTLVQEDAIIRQVAERFQISSRHMDSRINLKLHPAELGALKIDLTVKEGSIRANIVAQSQHSLEILEKNIQKLKTVLENLGFEVDQISITAESDSVGDFDLLDRQLFSQNDYTPSSHKGRREAEVAFSLDENNYTAPETSTGVNVKI